jgi:hypothetical protein
LSQLEKTVHFCQTASESENNIWNDKSEKWKELLIIFLQKQKLDQIYDIIPFDSPALEKERITDILIFIALSDSDLFIQKFSKFSRDQYDHLHPFWHRIIIHID